MIIETKQTASSDIFLENAKAAAKLFTDASASMLEVYKKQTNIASELYTNFFNSFLQTTQKNTIKNYSDMFFNQNGSSVFFNPFAAKTDNHSDSPFSVFEKFYKQLAEQNQNALETLSKQTSKRNAELSHIWEEYGHLVEARLEAWKKITDALSKTISSNLDNNTAENQRLQEEISRQTNILIKETQKFWTGVLNPDRSEIAYDEESHPKIQTEKTEKKFTKTTANV